MRDAIIVRIVMAIGFLGHGVQAQIVPEDPDPCDAPWVLSGAQQRWVVNQKGVVDQAGIVPGPTFSDQLIATPGLAIFRPIDPRNTNSVQIDCGVYNFSGSVNAQYGARSLLSGVVQERAICEERTIIENGPGKDDDVTGFFRVACARRMLLGMDFDMLLAQSLGSGSCDSQRGSIPGWGSSGPFFHRHGQFAVDLVLPPGRVFEVRHPVGLQSPTFAAVGQYIIDRLPPRSQFEASLTVQFVPVDDQDPLTDDSPVVIYSYSSAVQSQGDALSDVAVSFPLNTSQGAIAFSGVLSRSGTFIVDVSSRLSATSSEFDFKISGGLYIWLAEEPSLYGIPSLPAQFGQLQTGIVRAGCTNSTVPSVGTLNLLDPIRSPWDGGFYSFGNIAISRDASRWELISGDNILFPYDGNVEVDLLTVRATGPQEFIEDSSSPARCAEVESYAAELGRLVVRDVPDLKRGSSDDLRVRLMTIPLFVEPSAGAIPRVPQWVLGHPINSPADIANTDGDYQPAGDGVLDSGDFALFFASFFAAPSQPEHLFADIANEDGEAKLCPTNELKDNVVNNGDFNFFFQEFFRFANQ
jgi:hypothetical protein